MAALTRGLLDTSVLIDLADDDSLGLRLPAHVAISVATLAELHLGILVAKDESMRQLRLRRLGSFESAFEALPIDGAVARAFASVAHAVRLAGRQPRSRVMDLWIAATALANGIPLFTRNAADFEGLAGLLEVRSV